MKCLINVETIFKGSPGARSPTGVCLVELPTRAIREEVLTVLQSKSLKDSKDSLLVVKRGRTLQQKNRNDALRSALDIIKKSTVTDASKASILWQIEGSAERGIEIGGTVVFKQVRTDSFGSFVGTCAHL